MRNQVTCIILLILKILTVSYGFNGVKIIGGYDASDGDFPYQVSLRSKNNHFCGGSILNERWILTAGHCVVGQNPKETNVVVGTNLLSKGGDFYLVDKLILHENYDSFTIKNDIGLIHLSEDIIFGEKVQPIKLPINDFETLDKPAILSGWGRISTVYPVGLPDALQTVELRVIGKDICAAAFSGRHEIPETNICTLTKEGEGACHGDSGGPLTSDGIQIGIVSFGMPCAVGYPDVYTRVWSYVKWINERINNNNNNNNEKLPKYIKKQ